MDQPYTVVLNGAADIPPAKRIALEARYAKELEGFLGSPESVREHAISNAVLPDCYVDGIAPPPGAELQAARYERACEAAERAVWASEGGALEGARFDISIA
jgi:hypothetical protein